MDNKVKIEVAVDTQQATEDLLSVTDSVQELGETATLVDNASTYENTQQNLNQVQREARQTKQSVIALNDAPVALERSIARTTAELKKTSQSAQQLKVTLTNPPVSYLEVAKKTTQAVSGTLTVTELAYRAANKKPTGMLSGALELNNEFKKTQQAINNIRTTLQTSPDAMANVGKLAKNEFKGVFSGVQKIQNELQKDPKNIVKIGPQARQELLKTGQAIQNISTELNKTEKDSSRFARVTSMVFNGMSKAGGMAMRELATVTKLSFAVVTSGIDGAIFAYTRFGQVFGRTTRYVAVSAGALALAYRTLGAANMNKALVGGLPFLKLSNISGLKSMAEGVYTTVNALKRLSEMSQVAHQAVRRVGMSLLIVVAGISASIVRTVARVQEVNTRILGLSASTAEYNETQAYLSRTSTKLSSDIITLSNSYTRLLNLEKSGIITTDESRKMLEGFSNLAMKTGATSDQLGTAMYGLSQGLSAGVLRAEEFNQVMEPLPGLLQELDKASGVGSGGFRKLVNDGKITSEMFKDTLIVALASYDGAASRTAGNIVPTFTRMKNTLTNLQASFERPVTNSLVPLMNGMSSIFVGFQKGVSASVAQGGGFFAFLEGFARRIGEFFNRIGTALPEAIGMLDFSGIEEQINGIVEVILDLTEGMDLTTGEGLKVFLQFIINHLEMGAHSLKTFLQGFNFLGATNNIASLYESLSWVVDILASIGSYVSGFMSAISIVFSTLLQPVRDLFIVGALSLVFMKLARILAGFPIILRVFTLSFSLMFPITATFIHVIEGIYFLLTKVVWGLIKYTATSIASRVATSAFVVALKAQLVAMKSMSLIDFIMGFGKLQLAISLMAATAILGTWASENVAAIKWVKDALSGLIEKVFGLGNTGAADEQMVSMVEDLRAKTNDTTITVENYREKLKAYLAEEKKSGEAKVETAKKADKLKETYKNLGVKVKESAEDIKAMYATLTEMAGAAFEMRFSLIQESDPNAIKQTIALEEEKFLTMQALIQRDEDKRTLSIHNNVKLEESKVQRLKQIEEEVAAHKSQVEGEKLRAAQARSIYEMSVESAKGKKISEVDQKLLESQKTAAAKATQIAAEREGKIKSLESERGNILEEKNKKNADAEKQLQSLTEETLMSRINLTRQTLGQALQAYQQYAQKVKEIEQAITEEKKRQSEVLKGIDEKANDAAKKGMENLFKKQLEQGNTNAAYETSKNLELKAAQEIATKKAEFAEMSSQIEQAMQAKNFAKAVEIAKAQEQLGVTISEKQLSAKEAEIQRMVELGQLSEENAARELEAAGTDAQTNSKAMVLEAQERINAAMSQEKTIAQENANAQLGLVENLNTSFKALLEQFSKSKEGTALDVRFIPDSQEIDAFIAKMKGEKIDIAVNPTGADAIGVSQNAGGTSFAEVKGDQQEGLMNVSLKPNSEELDAYLQAKQEQGLNVKLMPDSAQVDSLINRLKEPTTSTHTITVKKEGVTAATGGLIKGPGTTTSDSIPAWLSHHEYVIPAKSVDYFGVDFFHALRNLQIPRFATGGLATAAGPQTFMNQITNITNEQRDLNPIQVNVGDHKIPLYGRTESAKALRTALRDLKRG